MPELYIFYILSFVVICSAILVVASNNIFHSALSLALTLLGVSAIFGLLGSFFMAGIQIFVYIGAIVVITIFAINLTKQKIGELSVSKWKTQAFLISSLFFISGSYVIYGSDKFFKPMRPIIGYEPKDNTNIIGAKFISDMLIPFESISFLMLSALIGAIVIIAKDKKER
jgi:NADH-quinone oxidoreductase subunit J